MKTKKLDAFYKQFRQIRESYEAMQEYQEAYRALMQDLKDEGDDFAFMYKLYRDMKEYSNDRINLTELNAPEHVMDIFKAFEVEEFTFSSRWTDTTKMAFIITKLGYKLTGMAEVNDTAENTSKVPAFIFTRVRKVRIAIYDPAHGHGHGRRLSSCVCPVELSQEKMVTMSMEQSGYKWSEARNGWVSTVDHNVYLPQDFEIEIRAI